MGIKYEKNIGLFYGSDSGNTEEIAGQLERIWTISDLEVIEASQMEVADYSKFDVIILALSTWYDGDLQSDFEEFYKQFTTIDFAGKIVALIGVGDQYGYAEYFVDGIGILGEIVLKNGGQIIGKWPKEGYQFYKSKGLFNENTFYGLALDFENQMELNEERLTKWVAQIEQELEQVFIAEDRLVAN